MQSKFLVLLAAYNGAQFIADQIRSILAQEKVSVDIIVGLDLCDDETPVIVEGFADSYSNVEVYYHASRRGSAGANFYSLVTQFTSRFCDYDFVAFSDQDDLWRADKLLTSAFAILDRGVDGVSSDVEAFWPDGKSCYLKKSYAPSKFDFFFEAGAPGCTYVVRSALMKSFAEFVTCRDVFSTDPLLIEFEAHDWLLYAFARRYFSWHILPRSTMYYRQHAANQVGANKGIYSALYRFQDVKIRKFAQNVLFLAKVLGEEQLETLICTKGLVSRLKLLKYAVRGRRRFRERIWLVLFCILGYLQISSEIAD